MPTIDRDGVAIHYEVHGSGDGTPLLLSHGFGATHAMFDVALPALADGRRCVTWDVRGHGDSDAPPEAERYSVELTIGDMLGVLDAAGVARAVLLGHSLGGYLSLELQRRHPERAAALVLVDTGPGYRNPDARAGWNEMCETYARTLAAKGLAGLPGSEEIQASTHRDVNGLVLAARGILTQHNADVLEHLPEVEVPALVIVGSEDRDFLSGASYLAAKIPNARRVEIAGAGHAPVISHTDEFVREVLEFLATVDQA